MNKPIDTTPMLQYTTSIGVRRKKTNTVSKTPEGKVKDAVKTILNETPNCWYFMPVQNGMGQAGIPDFICCVRGKFLAIETKSKYTSRKLTALQAKQIEQIQTACGTAVVVNEDNLDDLERIVTGL